MSRAEIADGQHQTMRAVPAKDFVAVPRIVRIIGVVNIGSFRVSATVAGVGENGEAVVLGTGHRAAQGIRRGYIIDMEEATDAVRGAIERAERMANMSLGSVWVGCSGAGLSSQIAEVEIEIGGRRIDQDDIEQLLSASRDVLHTEGREVLHAQPAHYTIDGAHGVANPCGLHAEHLSVDIHVMLAEAAPIRNLIEAVQHAHLDVEEVVASPLAAGLACLTSEERELGVALVDIGAELTHVSVYAGGMLVGMTAIAMGSGDITDAIASRLGIRRFQAERLKCFNGSAVASATDHREMLSLEQVDDDGVRTFALHADDQGRIPRSELIGIITDQLGVLMHEVAQALQNMGFQAGTAPVRATSGRRSLAGGQMVLTGGGAELAGLADFAEAALARPARIGRPLGLVGIPEAYATPSFATLAGLVLHAVRGSFDIRHGGTLARFDEPFSIWGLVRSVLRALRRYY